MKKTLKGQQLILVITAVGLCAAAALGFDYHQRVRPRQLSAEPTAAGTTFSNGQFSLTGGFWQPEFGGAPPPTPARTSFVMTNTNDSGAGSLLQAILGADAHTGADALSCQIPGPGVH